MCVCHTLLSLCKTPNKQASTLISNCKWEKPYCVQNIIIQSSQCVKILKNVFGWEHRASVEPFSYSASSVEITLLHCLLVLNLLPWFAHLEFPHYNKSEHCHYEEISSNIQKYYQYLLCTSTLYIQGCEPISAGGCYKFRPLEGIPTLPIHLGCVRKRTTHLICVPQLNILLSE